MIVFAFPTLGKSYYCQKFKNSYDYDFGSFKRRSSLANEMYIELAKQLESKVPVVFVNTILAGNERAVGQAVVFIPTYGDIEARERLVSRGDDPLEWHDFLDFFEELKSKWVNFACVNNFRVVYCNTVEEGMLRLKQKHVI